VSHLLIKFNWILIIVHALSIFYKPDILNWTLNELVKLVNNTPVTMSHIAFLKASSSLHTHWYPAWLSEIHTPTYRNEFSIAPESMHFFIGISNLNCQR